MRHDHPVLNRYFLALRVPGGAAFQIQRLRRSWTEQFRPVPMEHLHLTLAIVDDSPVERPDVIAALSRAAANVAADPFELRLDQMVGSYRSIALRPGKSDKLRRLGQHVQEALAAARIPLRADWRFSPHVTLGYRHGEPFHVEVAPVGFRASEFVLVHSQVGRTRHVILDRWPLMGERQMELSLL